MYRTAFIALVAGVAYDQYFLDGYYTRAIGNVMRVAMHHLIG